MKVVREIKRKYYKYVESEFVQPILTSNGTIGGDSFAVYSDIPQLSPNDVFYAFDGVNTACFHSTSGSTVGYIIFYNPNPIKVTNIQVWNQNASGAVNRASLSGTIYGSNDNFNWETITTYTNTNGDINGKWDISLASNNNYYKYYKIYSNGTNSSYWTIGELTLTVYPQILQESTPDNYDYYVDEPVYKAIREIERKYYKYVESEWIQPILNSNGTLGVDDVACYTNYGSNWAEIYKIFSVSTDVCNAMGSPFANMEWILYTKNPICITRFYGTFLNCTTLKLYGSNDNVNYVQIPFTYLGATQSSFDYYIDNTQYFHYYKWLSAGQAYISSVSTCPYNTKMKIEATQRVTQESTQSDYDYYIDIPVYHAINN